MANNALVTGPPRSGKTTAIDRAVTTLRDNGYDPGGVYCPEILDDGTRVGFAIVDVRTDRRKVMGHVDFRSGPRVAKYRIDVPAIDEICGGALPRALEGSDFIIIDEIAPMEIESDVFVTEVRRALDADRPVIAAIHQRSTAGFIGAVKRRPDVTEFIVSRDTRDQLPKDLAAFVRDRSSPQNESRSS